MITVIIPVGPNPSNKRWLDECIDSVKNQTRLADEILIIDDMAHLEECGPGITVWKSPWLLGVPNAFNFGVALAKHELVVMLGSDDRLESEALEKLQDTFKNNNMKDGYYHFTIKYSNDDEIQDLPNNCAAVTKGLWNMTGGFPPEASVGACDHIFISMMIKNHSKLMIPVAKGNPLYWYRRHQESDTGTRSNAYLGCIATVRDVFTNNWKKPNWT